MVNDAAVVYVFLDDTDKVVSSADLKEWLQIMDEIVEMKLQYDATSRRTCYAVEFRRATSAQQAMQYLNGSRFKNCVVTIQSRHFAAAPVRDTSAAASDDPNFGGSSSSAALSATSQARKRCRETRELPHNHLVPSDLQMDAVLAERLPEAAKSESETVDVRALWRDLTAAQEKLVSVYKKLDETATHLAEADARLATLLNVPLPQSSAHAAATCFSSSAPTSTSATALMAESFVSHHRGIPCDADTPTSVVSFVTSTFGPVASAAVTVAQRDFFLIVRFVFAADEANFLRAAASDGNSEREKRLLTLGWSTIDRACGAANFSRLPPCDDALQSAVRHLLL